MVRQRSVARQRGGKGFFSWHACATIDFFIIISFYRIKTRRLGLKVVEATGGADGAALRGIRKERDEVKKKRLQFFFKFSSTSFFFFHHVRIRLYPMHC